MLVLFLSASALLVLLYLQIVCGDLSRFKQGASPLGVHTGIEPEVYMNATQLITSKGYPCENYWVTTEDGYILNLVRIPHGRNNTVAPNRPVVFLQHGLIMDATTWITNPANESLAFILADKGADVWIGNNRGNLYAMNHTHLNPEGVAFWQFSWENMSRYDLPANVDFALKVSKADQLYYVGHSQGTTQMFAKLSEDQDFGEKIKHFIALAPVARIGHAKSPFCKLAPIGPEIFELFGWKRWLVEPEWLAYLQGDLCQKQYFPQTCENILFILCGFDARSMNITRMPVYLSHVPSGTSTMDIDHWAQAVLSDQFKHYDYRSPVLNMQHYNQTTPPLYNLANIKVPVATFRGGNDWFSDDTDNEWLLTQINVTKDRYVQHYEHMDFIWAFDVVDTVYREVLGIVFQKS